MGLVAKFALLEGCSGRLVHIVPRRFICANLSDGGYSLFIKRRTHTLGLWIDILITLITGRMHCVSFIEK